MKSRKYSKWNSRKLFLTLLGLAIMVFFFFIGKVTSQEFITFLIADLGLYKVSDAVKSFSGNQEEN